MDTLGTYIYLDGLEGCGKTTQAKLLATYCEAHKIPYIHIRQPGSTPLAELLRSTFLSGDYKGAPQVEFLMLMTAWLETHTRVVLPALAEGKVVISERGLSTLYAYQFIGRQIEEAMRNTTWVNFMHDLIPVEYQCTRFNYREVYVYLEQSDERMAERMLERSQHAVLDHMELEKLEFFQRVRRGLEEFGTNQSPSHPRLFAKHRMNIENMNIDQVFMELSGIVDRYHRGR